MSASESLYNEDIISNDAIDARLDYLEFLDDNEFLSEGNNLEFWADEIDELAELKALIEAIGTDAGDLISEHYWETYATSDADESFDLEKTGAYKYFDYSSYADDMQTDYSQVQFHGTTYYYQ